jgi:hypothetical protein
MADDLKVHNLNGLFLVTSGSSGAADNDVVIVLDMSGSMAGARCRLVKQIVSTVANDSRKGTLKHVGIGAFNGGSFFWPSVDDALRHMAPGGKTDFFAAAGSLIHLTRSVSGNAAKDVRQTLEGMRLKSPTCRPTPPSRKLVIMLVSDGEGENASTARQLLINEMATLPTLAVYTEIDVVLVGLGSESAAASMKSWMDAAFEPMSTSKMVTYKQYVLQFPDSTLDEVLKDTVGTTMTSVLDTAPLKVMVGSEIRSLTGSGIPVSATSDMTVHVVPIDSSGFVSVNGLAASEIPVSYTDATGLELAFGLYTLGGMREAVTQALPLASKDATQALHDKCTSLVACFSSRTFDAAEDAGADAESAPATGSSVGEEGLDWLAERFAKFREIHSGNGEAGAGAGTGAGDSEHEKDRFLKEYALFLANTEKFRSAAVDVDSESLESVWGRTLEAKRTRRNALVEVKSDIEGLLRRVLSLHHGMSSQEALRMLAETSAVRKRRVRAENATAAQNGDAVRRLLANGLNPLTVDVDEGSLAAMAEAQVKLSQSAGVVDAVFFAPGAACPVHVQAGATFNVDSLWFVVDGPAFPGVPMNMAHVLSSTPPGLVDMTRYVPGLDRSAESTTNALSPMPGFPAALLACLPAMLSVIATHSVDAAFNLKQVLAAYPCFVLGGLKKGPGPVREAARLALAAFLELLCLDTQSDKVRALVPRSLCGMKLEIHSTASDYSGIPLPASVPREKFVNSLKDLLQEYVQLVKTTPSAATSGTFSPSTALLLWAAAYARGEGASVGGAGASVGGAGAGAGAAAGSSTGPRGAGASGFSRFVVRTVTEMVVLQHARAALQTLGGQACAELVMMVALECVGYTPCPAWVMETPDITLHVLKNQLGQYFSSRRYLEVLRGQRTVSSFRHLGMSGLLKQSPTLQVVAEKIVQPTLSMMKELVEALKDTVSGAATLADPCIYDPLHVALRALLTPDRGEFEKLSATFDVWGKLDSYLGRVLKNAEVESSKSRSLVGRDHMASEVRVTKPSVATVFIPFGSFSATPEGCARSVLLFYRYHGPDNAGSRSFPAKWWYGGADTTEEFKTQLVDQFVARGAPDTAKTVADMMPRITDAVLREAARILLRFGSTYPRRGHAKVLSAFFE